MANSPPPESNPPPPTKRLEQLLAALVTELDRCAQVRWDDPVVFAWRARRCLEVILLGVLTKHAPQHAATLRNPTIDTFVRHDTLKRENPSSPIGKDLFNVIDTVHAFGNTAAHYQFEDVNHAENAVVVALGLARVVEWFHRFLNEPIPPETARLLEALRDPTRQVPNASQREVEQLRGEALAREAEQARSERALRLERDETRGRLAELERALLEARTQATALARAHDETRARADLLEQQSSEAQAQLAAARRGRGLAALTAAAVGLCVGAGLALTLRDRPAPHLASPPGDVAEAVPREEPPRGPASTAALPVVPFDAAQATPDVAAPAPTCPAGFVLYDVHEVTLQPWPPGARRWGAALHPGRSTRYALTPFCLRERAETVGDVRPFRPSLLDAKAGCARLPGGEAQRATCVLHQEAEAYCAERWQGRLPTVLEWEAAAREVERGGAAEVQRWRRAADGTAEGQRAQNELEWVADGFPAAPFDLGAARPGEWMTRAPIPPEPWPGAYPRHSWNRHGEGRDMYIGFRCATAPR